MERGKGNEGSRRPCCNDHDRVEYKNRLLVAAIYDRERLSVSEGFIDMTLNTHGDGVFSWMPAAV